MSEATLPRAFGAGILRRLATTDLPAFQAYRCDAELGRFQGWSPMPDDEAAAFLAEMSEAPLFRPGEWIQLGIADAEGRLLGDLGLLLDADGHEAEIGFTLARSAHGRGIATAAAREAIALTFASTAVEQVRGITDARNTASVRVMERLGMRRVQTRETVFRGEACTEAVHALARADGGPAARPVS